MRKIIFNEWQGLWRNGIFKWIFLLYILLLTTSSIFGIFDTKERNKLAVNAKATLRQQWESMGPSNPHNAAHFGTYVFKPISPLSALDEGVNRTVGKVLRLEGHVQNELIHSDRSQSIITEYFGPLRPSTILLIITPLLVILLTFQAIQSELQSDRVRLVMIQGATYRQLIVAKIISIWSLAIIVLVTLIAIQLALNDSFWSKDLFLRVGLFSLVYAIFYWILISLTASVTAWLKTTSGLTLMLALWVLWTVFLPKFTSSFVSDITVLPKRQEFVSAMRKDRSEGIDGHNPTSSREQALKDSILTIHGVKELDSLPFNYDGILMQADEEYGNIVWDKHFGNLYKLLHQQKWHFQQSGILNPLGALQSLSMGIAATDYWHHLHFQNEAESYRRIFIKALNDEHAYGGSKTGQWEWTANQEFFNKIKDFDYQSAAYKEASGYYFFDWAYLLIWFLLANTFLAFVTRKFNPLIV